MLTVHHLKKSFDSHTLFEDVTFSLNPAEKVGLVGPNGCGKTTLLRMIAGLESPSGGQITRDPTLRIGYLAQGFEPDPQAKIGELIGRQDGSAEALYKELESLSTDLAKHPEDEALQQRYDRLVSQVSAPETGHTVQILTGLGLDAIDMEMPAGYLSGGQKTRLSLSMVLMGNPQLLLLDEPTNHLDIGMLEWLEAWLKTCPCGALLVSHDRTFLDQTVRRILELDPQRGFHEYAGNYSDYIDQRQAEIERQWQAYADQQIEIQRMKADVTRVKAQAAYTERQASSVRIGGSEMKNKGYKDYQRSIAKKVARKAKAREKKLERYLESDECIDRPQADRQIKLEFNGTPHLGRSVVWMQDLSVGYTLGFPLLHGLNLEIQANRRIALTGSNGSGKTTLLRTIAGEIPPLAGNLRIGTSVRLGTMSQDQSDLDPGRSALETVADQFDNETRARTFLSLFLFTGDEPLKPISMLSYGQRARLILARLVATGCNFLLLDEPINHLDIPSRSQFEGALKAFEGTVLAVVHDRYFIERFADEVWVVQDGHIHMTHPFTNVPSLPSFE